MATERAKNLSDADRGNAVSGNAGRGNAGRGDAYMGNAEQPLRHQSGRVSLSAVHLIGAGALLLIILLALAY